MKRLIFSFLFCVLIGLTGFSQQTGLFSGTLKDKLTSEPLFGVKVSAGAFVTRTDHDGSFSLLLPAGDYDVFLRRYGLYDLILPDISVINGDTVTIDTVMKPFPVGPAIVKQEDNGISIEVSWHYAGPGIFEKSIENGEVDDFFLFTDAGSQVAGKFDCNYDNVVGGQIFVGDSNFPGPFIGSRFVVKVYDDEGMEGRPGNTLDEDTIVVDQYGWMGFDSLNAVYNGDNFYMSMVQLQDAPESVPVGVASYPPGNHSIMKYQDFNWEQFPIGNVMIRPWVAQEHDSLKVVNYRVGRFSNFDPNGPPQAGTLTELATTTGNYYVDNAWGGLPAGWYCYGIKCLYNNGIYSDYVVSDNWYGFISDATVNISLSDQSARNDIFVNLSGYYPVNEVFTAITNYNGDANFNNIDVGEFMLSAYKPRFDLYTEDTLVIHSDTVFSGFELQESRIPVDSLVVNPFTCLLEWKNASITQFDWNCADPGNCHDVTTPEISLGIFSSWLLSCEFFYNAEYEHDYLDYSTDHGRTWAHIVQLQPSPEMQYLEINLDSLIGPGGPENYRFQLRDNHGSPYFLDIRSMRIWSTSIKATPASYQVILDTLEAGWSDSTSFRLPPLENGAVYQAGIAANYSTGLADTVFIEFTYHELFPPRNLLVTKQTDSLICTWSLPEGSWDLDEPGRSFPDALQGYKVYFDGPVSHMEFFIPDPMDTSLSIYAPNCDTASFTVTAVYDLSDYGYAGEFESQPEGPAPYQSTGPLENELFEDWLSMDYYVNCWSREGYGFGIDGTNGKPAPAFTFRNIDNLYSASLTSHWIHIVPSADAELLFEFELDLDALGGSGYEYLEIQVQTEPDAEWETVQGVSDLYGNIEWLHFSLNISNVVNTETFRVRFHFAGIGSIPVRWTIDNIHLYNHCEGIAAFSAQLLSDSEVLLSWESPPGSLHNRSLSNYNIYRKAEQEDFILLAETPDSVYTDMITFAGQYCYKVSAIYNDQGIICESPETDSSCIISHLGYQDINDKGKIRVYPNPAQDYLVISCADDDIQSLVIYNSIGLIKEINGENRNEIILNLKDLAPGIYFIRVNLEDVFFLEKIIHQD
jgi:hypothetical protein